MKCLIIICSLLMGCGDATHLIDPCPPDCDTLVNSAPAIIWKKQSGSVFGSFTFTPYVLDQAVYNSITLSGSGNDYDTIVARNKLTGERLNYYVHNDHSSSLASKGGQTIHDEDLYFVQNKQFVKLNLPKHIVEEFNTDVTYINSNRFYLRNSQMYGSSDKGDVASKLFRVDTKSGLVENIIQFDLSNGFTPSVEISQIFVDENQDSVIVFQNRQYNFPKSLDKVDLYAMRLKDKKILWELDSLTPSGNSSISIGVSKDDKIFFPGDYIMYCLDAASGKINWLFKFLPTNSRTLIRANPILADGKLIVKTDDNTIWAFDPDTGQIVWQNHEAGETPSNLTVSGDRLYYTSAGSGFVYCHSIKTGEVIWKYEVEKPDYSDQCFCSGGVGIDPETGYLYVHDYYYIYCLKEGK